MVVPGLPADFQSLTLTTFAERSRNPEVIQAAQEWLAGTHDLYITGPVGVGKTALACALLNDVYRRGGTARFTFVGTLLEQHRAAMFSDEDETRRLGALAPYFHVGVLALDDVGRDKGSDYARQTLQTIYDERRARAHRTIWTSNLDLGALQRFFDDDRLPSRIAGAAEIVFLGGDDWRTQGWRALREARP